MSFVLNTGRDKMGALTSFDEWLRSEGLSEASVIKYNTAIKGVLSDWAREAGMLEDSLLEIRNETIFQSIKPKIEKLPIYIERNLIGHNMYGSALNKYAKFLSDSPHQSVALDIEDIVTDQTKDVTEKTLLVNARIGQGQFRKDLIDLWGCCSVTGYTGISMLVASHIKPWSHSSDSERLDKYNGLLLLPNLDKAFDCGLVSFRRSGNIIFSRYLHDARVLGIKHDMSISFANDHLPFIEYHNEIVFKGV